jgi:hypothetical protein
MVILCYMPTMYPWNRLYYNGNVRQTILSIHRNIHISSVLILNIQSTHTCNVIGSLASLPWFGRLKTKHCSHIYTLQTIWYKDLDSENIWNKKNVYFITLHYISSWDVCNAFIFTENMILVHGTFAIYYFIPQIKCHHVTNLFIFPCFYFLGSGGQVSCLYTHLKAFNNSVLKSWTKCRPDTNFINIHM